MRYKYIIPSFLSSLRIVFALLLLFFPERYWLVLIVLAAISDFLDGWVARRWQVQSWQGGLVDAAADKIFILVTLSVFVVADKFSLWWIFPVIVRDIMVAVTVVYAITQREWAAFKDMDARISGKLTTCGQFTLFAVVLLLPGKALYALVLASFCSIIAGFDYGRLFYQALRCKLRRK